MEDVYRPVSSKNLPQISRMPSRANSCAGLLRPALTETPIREWERLGSIGENPKHRRLRTAASLNSPEDFAKNKTKLGLIRTYRNLQSETRKSKLNNESTPELKYFKEIEKYKLKPETSIFTRKSSQTHLNLQEFGLGDNYAAAVSVAISNTPSLQTLNFRNNRLRESGSLRIIETLQLSAIKEVNLSENHLGSQSVEALAKLLLGQSCIEKLSLERALMHTKLVNQLLLSIAGNKRLLELSLARNEITSSCGAALYKVLTSNNTLKVLDLHWNTIRGPAAVLLFRGLAKNNTLRVLDVSWNSMGRESNPDTLKALAKLFGENTSLQHLDLSNNYFTIDECIVLSDSVKSNHTIVGMHMDGNDCDVDVQGFLIPKRGKRKDIESHLSHRMISPHNFRSSRVLLKHCWLCDKWQAVTFIWNIEEVAWNRRLKHIAQEHRMSLEPVFLHLDIDDYRPELMAKEEDGSYQISRAIPITGAKFFFTYRGFAQISSAYSIFAPTEQLKKEIFFFNDYSKTITVVLFNQVLVFDNPCTLDTDFPVIPRPVQWVYMADPDDYAPILPEWAIATSSFKQYKLDTPVSHSQELMQECLDFDWTHSRMGNIIRDAGDQTKAKSMILPIYKQL